MCRKKEGGWFLFIYFFNLRNHFPPLYFHYFYFIRAKVCIVFSLFVFRDKANRADFEALKPECLFFLRVGGKDLQHTNKLVKHWKEGNGRVLTVIEGMENLFGNQDKKLKRVHSLLVLHWLFGGKTTQEPVPLMGNREFSWSLFCFTGIHGCKGKRKH